MGLFRILLVIFFLPALSAFSAVDSPPPVYPDKSKLLVYKDDAGKGHNRWHPDIPSVVEADPMEEVTIETRESSDGQIRPGKTAADLLKMEFRVVHPLTGPVLVKGRGDEIPDVNG